MKSDLATMAASAYRTYYMSRGTIPEHDFETLPADQQRIWEDVAFAVLVQTAQLAFEHTKQMEGFVQ